MTKQAEPDMKTITQAKYAAKLYKYTFLGSWGMKINGFLFIPGCAICQSPRIKKLKGPFENKKGEIFYFECQDCKKPVNYTAVYPTKGRS